MYLFELGEYPQDSCLAKYEKELIKLLELEDNSGIVVFSNKIFKDCVNYLEKSFNLKIPNLYLNLMNHRAYTELCDKMDLLLGKIPRNTAIIYGNKLGDPPEICVDFEKHSIFFLTGQPINFLVNLIADYLEELIHSADSSKSETEIHQTVCDAFEGFTKVKLTDEIKKNRLDYSEKVDKTKILG